MVTLKIEGGTKQPAGDIDASAKSIKITPKASFTLDISRKAAEPVSLTVNDDDVMQIELDGGILIWTRVDEFRKDFPQPASRSDEKDTLILPVELPIGSPSRGVSSWILKGLKIFGVDPAEKTALKLAELVEKGLDTDEPGLYRLDSGDKFKLLKVGKEDIPQDQPILIFIHGTASSTRGSFGELWETQQQIRKDIFSHYHNQVYALEHRTLSESPIDNAIHVLKSLPKKATIHLVSHSRGGLVGELLCHATVIEGHEPFSEELRLRYAEAGERHTEQVEKSKTISNDKIEKLKEFYKKQANHLETLNDSMLNSEIKVERFVRTACPARGTTLASGRLDRWLSILVNLICQVPGLKENPLYEGLTEFTLAVVKERTDPTTIPGLEAQMPESPFIRLLNLSGITVQADLSVISGDIEPDSFWGKLKYLIPDLYYGQDHDLVVDTHSMFGGARREPGKARYFFDQGSDVNHFRYFENDITARQLWRGLSRSDDSDAGFHPLPEKAGKRIVRAVGASDQPQPIVFVLPGIMGSHLSVDGNRIWVDPWDLAWGGLAKLAIDQPDIAAESPVDSAYENLIEYLGDTHEVIPFPYDWRKSLLDEADRFAVAVESALVRSERNRLPVSFVAHSMGGLLVRTMISKRPDLWERVCKSDNSRFLMLGTPNNGSFTIPRLLVGQEKLAKSLALLDFKNDMQQHLKIISRFPGVLQLLPVQHDRFQFLDHQMWQDLHQDDDPWPLPDKQDLLSVEEFQKRLLESPIDPQRMLYIAGCAHATPVDIQVNEKPEDDEDRIRFIASRQGDGRVPWATGIPSGVNAWYMNAEHGELADYKPGFSAIKELLERGTTDLLSKTPPIERGVPDTFPLPPDRANMLPDQDTLYEDMLGFHHKMDFAAKSEPVKVSVTHGSLGYARNTIAIGHYRGDSILSAEAYVDRLYQGQLQRLLDFDIYPGGLNTSTLIHNPATDPRITPAALIIGLGDVGKLTPAKLTSTFSHALLSYATIEMNNLRSKTAKPGPLTMNISTLLIGTGYGGMNLEDSIMAILEGVLHANRQLDQNNCKGVRFEEIEFIEIWEDLAIQTAHAMKCIDSDAGRETYGLDGHFEYEKALQLGKEHNIARGARLKTAKGGKKRIFAEEPAGWWRRLQITEDKQGGLKFNTLTDRARNEITLHDAERTMVDEFIKQAVNSVQNNEELSRTLFELLLPYRLKEHASDNRDLVLVLDEKAAYYPWELIQDRWGDSNKPMVITHGVLRQLDASIFRETPRVTQEKIALVIGNPQSDFVDLPGAKREAQLVWKLLGKKKYDCEMILGEHPDHDAKRIINKLHAKSYRVLHLAGHGVYRYQLDSEVEKCETCGQEITSRSNEVTGMVIGRNAFLTPGDIRNMRFVPELVFINCCHLGHIDTKGRRSDASLKYKLAANLATEFIRMGVKAVVAAGWAVNDTAAETFASRFYQEMLNGESFGKAVLKARIETYKHKGSNTWGAYQCYGDPDYRLDGKTKHDNPAPRHTEVVNPAEATALLNEIATNTENASEGDLKLLAQRTKSLVDLMPEEWKKSSEISSVLGKTWSDLGNFEEAIRCYEQSINSEKGSFSTSTIEQLANLRSRTAIRLWQKDKKNMQEALELLKQAEDELNKLVSFSETCERFSLLAGNYRRKAWIDSRNRKKWLKNMSHFYKKAYDRNQSIYPRINWLTAEVILSWYSPGIKNKPFQQDIDQLEKELNQSSDAINDFWAATAFLDFKLLKYLNERTLSAQIETIVSGYQDARKKGATLREFDSVLGHIEFLISMTAIIKLSKERKSALVPLQTIYDGLK